MNDDIQGKGLQASASITCHGCRKPVDPKHERTMIERIDQVQDKESIAWHQDCFNRFLEAGEET